MGNTNRKFVLGMLLAGVNRYIEKSWRLLTIAKAKATEAVQAKTRSKRRTGTLPQILGNQPKPEPTRPAPARRHTPAHPLRT